MDPLKEFPSLEDVHVVLSDLTNLFEDRNAMLNAMFKEDKYKDFLLAENIQSIVEADRRDDSQTGGIRQDLLNGYEILKARTTLKKFANFISPGSLPIMDLDAPIEMEEGQEDEEVIEETAESGEDGKDGADGQDGAPGQDGKDGATIVQAPSNNKPNVEPNQTPDVKLAKGGFVNPATPMMNALSPSGRGSTPPDHSKVRSLEDLGLDGESNVASEFAEDLGLDKYKSALASAMALPLKAVAAGLGGLLSKLSMPDSPEFTAAKSQISNITEAFGVPKPSMEKEETTTNSSFKNSEQLIAGGGIFSTVSNMFNLAKDKDHGVSDQTPMGAAVTGLQRRRQQNEALLKSMNSGGPSLETTDTISASANEHYDQTRTSIKNVAESAKNIFKSSTAKAFSTTSSILNQILGGTSIASVGSQYNKQDINSLTNQVIEQNEIMMAENNQITVNDALQQNSSSSLESKLKAAALTIGSSFSPDMTSKGAMAPTELEVSKFLLGNVKSVQGGETPHDVV